MQGASCCFKSRLIDVPRLRVHVVRRSRGHARTIFADADVLTRHQPHDSRPRVLDLRICQDVSIYPVDPGNDGCMPLLDLLSMLLRVLRDVDVSRQAVARAVQAMNWQGDSGEDVLNGLLQKLHIAVELVI